MDATGRTTEPRLKNTALVKVSLQSHEKVHDVINVFSSDLITDKLSAYTVQLKIDTYSPRPNAEHTLVNMFSAVSTKESFHFSDVWRHNFTVYCLWFDTKTTIATKTVIN